MADSAEHEAAQADVDHRLGDVEPGFVIAHEAPPAGHPAERSLDHPSAGQRLEALLVGELVHDLDDEVVERRHARQPTPLVSTVGKQMLQPGPASANGCDDPFGSGRVLHVPGCQVDHQQPAVGIDRDVTLAPFDPLRRVVTAAARGGGRLHRLAVQHTSARARRPAGTLTIEHQSQVVDGAEQQSTDEAPEPPVDGLPRREVVREHSPAAAGPGQVADRVQNLAQVHSSPATAMRGVRQQRLDPGPLRMGQIARIAPALESRLARTLCLSPHPAHMGAADAIATHPITFSNGLLDPRLR